MTNNPAFRRELEDDPMAALRGLSGRMDVPIRLDNITLDPRAQPREQIDPDTVETYAADMLAEAVFPPVDIFTDGHSFWLADGWHRYHAARSIGRETISALLHEGDLRGAILFAAAANTKQGLRRTNADKRRAVLALLNDPEWAQWGNREIARRCGVHHELVGAIRASLAESSSERQYTTKHGTVTTMKTANIGRLKPEVQRARDFKKTVRLIIGITKAKLPAAPSEKERAAVVKAIQEARKRLDELEAQL